MKKLDDLANPAEGQRDLVSLLADQQPALGRRQDGRRFSNSPTGCDQDLGTGYFQKKIWVDRILPDTRQGPHNASSSHASLYLRNRAASGSCKNAN